MKAYIGNVDWADEGNVFFYSLETEERLQAMKELIKILEELDLIPGEIEMYWGTNEFFRFDATKLLRFINQAQDISDEELMVFDKFGVYGFDIYQDIDNSIFEEWLNPRYDTPELSKEDLDKIEPHYILLYGQEQWDELKESVGL